MTLARQLTKLLGPDRVATDAPTLATHATDKWFASRTPEAVVFAESTDDVSRLLKFATRHRVPVTPRGAGVGYVGGCVPVRGGIALSLARMNRIKEINFADAVAVVEPGVITGVLQAEASKRGLFYPPDPASLKECSLGGNIATNAGGPRCLKYGVTRHYVLGLEVVLADGRVLRTGGRTHKNKTGFDLIGMFVGSEGLLGVVTEATLRLLPRPPARATLSASFRTFRAAANAVQARAWPCRPRVCAGGSRGTLLLRKMLEHPLGERGRDLGALGDLEGSRLLERGHGTERLQQLRAPRRSHSGHRVERAADARARPQLAVVLKAETMRLVAQPLQRAQARRTPGQTQIRQTFAHDQLFSLGQTDRLDPAGAHAVE